MKAGGGEAKGSLGSCRWSSVARVQGAHRTEPDHGGLSTLLSDLTLQTTHKHADSPIGRILIKKKNPTLLHFEGK